jgi:hypothetical protein
MLYQIRESTEINTFVLLLYGLALLSVVVFVSGSWLMTLLSLLLILLLITDLTRHKAADRDDPMALTLHDKTGRIEIKQANRNHQYARFKLFSNRWFLILQLKNEESHKNLFLIPQRFRSTGEYLQFRYAIINMSRN